MPYFQLFTELDKNQDKHLLNFQQKRCCSRTHYEVLGLERDATSKEIRQRFIKLSKELHPDINKDPKNHEKFVKVNEAYSTLIKPSNRRDYDLSLASRVRQRYQESSSVGSHTYGSSNRPGTGAGSEEGQFYWDETLWHWRDQSKDKYYEQQAEQRGYYGVRGWNRIANSKIVLGCLAVMVFGGLLHYYTFYKTSASYADMLNARDQKIAAYHKSAKENAKLHGNIEQLERLKAKARLNRYTVQNFDDDE